MFVKNQHVTVSYFEVNLFQIVRPAMYRQADSTSRLSMMPRTGLLNIRSFISAA